MIIEKCLDILENRYISILPEIDDFGRMVVNFDRIFVLCPAVIISSEVCVHTCITIMLIHTCTCACTRVCVYM